MKAKNLYKQNLQQHLDVVNASKDLDAIIYQSIFLLTESITKGGKIIFCGNGGSAADSQHLASEFTGRFIKDREPIASLALTTDSSALTCISNDYSYEQVFARQLKAIGKEGDVFVGISTSGNSNNIIEAIKVAKDMGIKTISLLGNDGGAMKDLGDLSIIIPSDVTARIQEMHILVGHTLCGGVEQELGLV
jgi:D-sedoheptulose 7-phosphate isomerase